MYLQLIWTLAAIILGLTHLYLRYIRRHSYGISPTRKRSPVSLTLCAVAGSGGHTAELLSVMRAFKKQYGRRVYILAHTDKLSEQKVLEFEQSQSEGDFQVERVGRSREVKQSYITSTFTTVLATIDSLFLMWRTRPDILLCNGPGVCIPLCCAAALLDLLRLRDIRIFYVESLCRVKSLSLTGQILYKTHIPDIFFVHWQDLAEKFPRSVLVPSSVELNCSTNI